MNFSDYIVYVDESGDHNLDNVNSKYPIFVLAFCIFNKRYYNNHTVKEIQNLKFNYFGHDMIILHERDILKRKGVFNQPNETHQAFLNDISELMKNNKFVVIACVIRKDELPKADTADNPYHLAMSMGLERLNGFLDEKRQQDNQTFVVFEQRGLNEDKLLKAEFERVCQDKCYPFQLILASKYANSSGMQLADLIARPVGNHVLRPAQTNRAFDIIKHKFYCKHGASNTRHDYADLGLRVYP